jgi:hypothetical protein
MNEYNNVACYDVMCWFFWDATFFVITLQDDTKDSSNCDFWDAMNFVTTLQDDNKR